MLDESDLMSPPSPRAPTANLTATNNSERLVLDDESESESAAELSLRNGHAQSSSSLHFNRPRVRKSASHSASGSRKRRRRSHSQSQAAALGGGEKSESLPLNAPMAGNGVFRDRISSNDADPAEKSGAPPPNAEPTRPTVAAAAGGEATRRLASDANLARAAMLRAGVPQGDIFGLLVEQSQVETSEQKRFAVPLRALYEADACPLCEESAPILQRAAQIRIASTANIKGIQRTSQAHQEEVAQTIQARTAMVKEELKKHELIFKVEAELRSEMPDRRVAVYVVRMRRCIERELAASHIPYVRWTIEMVMDHFNVFNDHIRDKVRTAAYVHDLVLKQIPRIQQCMYVPSMTNPGTMLLDTRAAKALTDMIRLQMDAARNLTATQNTVDPSRTATLRGLTDVINSFSNDEVAASVTTDPEASAGMNTRNQPQNNRLGASSAKSIYEINAL